MFCGSSRTPSRVGPAFRLPMETDKTAAVPVLSRILAQLQRGDIQIPSAPAVVTELRLLVGNPDLAAFIADRTGHRDAVVNAVSVGALSGR